MCIRDRYVTNAFSTDIKAEFKDDEEPRQVSVAGRIMSRRVMGKASFVELQDSKGRIQVYITRDDICPGEDKELYNSVFKRLLDLGDFIGIEGRFSYSSISKGTITTKSSGSTWSAEGTEGSGQTLQSSSICLLYTSRCV